MAFNGFRMTRIGVLAANCLLLSACGEPVPTDAALIAELRFDRTGFEEAIKVACEAPAITDFELRGQNPPQTKPASLDPGRVRSLQTFMVRHDISRLYFECGPPIYAAFDVASVGLGVSGQLKQLIFSPSGLSENDGGGRVADTDVAVAGQNKEWIAVHRDIGDGWFIRNSR